MPLTDPEIEVVVQRYYREMTQYEEAARLVEDRLRRATHANTIRVLLSARAKHPDDLRKKLERKRDDPRYLLSSLDVGMDRIVTDLAGCRVMAYQSADVVNLVRIVRENLDLANIQNAEENHDKPSGYRAVHLLIAIGKDEERYSLRGTICEVQITSIASHIFNELEHDIRYKNGGVAPSDAERVALDGLLDTTRLVDPFVDRLMRVRASSTVKQTTALKDPEELKYALEQDAQRPLHGEFHRLFRLLDSVSDRLTPAFVFFFGSTHVLLEKGEKLALEFEFDNADDVVKIALALFEHFPDEFRKLVQEQRGPTTLLKKAILKAAESRKS